MDDKKFKDLFSKQSADYSKYRPTYPQELFEYLASISEEKKLAWDVGTGNGQAALGLTKYFEKILATDLSQKQLDQAPRHPKITYECVNYPQLKNEVNLTAVAQAFHWFNHQEFFQVVKNVSAPGAILAVWCYGLAEIEPEVDKHVYFLYENILGEYWDKERVHVENGYKSIQVPFRELSAPQIKMQAQWSFEDLVGYLGTWSSLQKYKTKVGLDPRIEISQKIERVWGSGVKQVKWPLSLRVFQL